MQRDQKVNREVKASAFTAYSDTDTGIFCFL